MLKSKLLVAVILCGIGFSATAQQAPDVKLKFGKGLQMTAADSSFHIKASFRFQTLFVTEGTDEDGSEWSSNAVVRRSRIKFNGWILNPNFGYKVELALSNRDLASSNDWSESGRAPKIVLDAVAKWKVAKNLELWAGQTKLPGNRERVISSQALQFVDRSKVNSNFNIDRDMGIHLRYKFKAGDGVIKPMAAISMGEGRNIVIDNIGGYSYTGRIEYLPFGEFTSKGDYFGSDLKREDEPKLALGATYNLNEGASRQKQAGAFLGDSVGGYLQNDISTIFVDAMFKYKGFSLMAEYAQNEILTTDGKDLETTQDEIVAANGKSYSIGNGISVQAGYLFKSNWEAAARFTQVTPEWDKSFTGLTEYTFGVSRYVVGHNLKVQTDVSYTDVDGTDVNGLRYRLQFEIAF